jgi:sulfur carrier protein
VDIILNGKPSKLAENSSLLQLIYNLDLAPEKIALELNRQVVRRADWSSTILKEGDQVEIVHFVGGGLAGEGRCLRAKPKPC